MESTYKQLTDFLVSLGTEAVEHSNKSYLAHLIGVYRDMQTAGCTEELCRAGMFHSIYGTELFQRFSLALERRAEVRALLGERAERLAYLNCAMDRATFDDSVARGSEPHRVVDRITGAEVILSAHDFDDLCRIHLYDWLEQVPRSRMGWGYRREAFRRMAEHLGGPAMGAYDRAFATEPAAS
jgi:hypothetical protein